MDTISPPSLVFSSTADPSHFKSPSEIMAMWSASTSASSRKWVVRIMVLLERSARIMFHRTRRESGSCLSINTDRKVNSEFAHTSPELTSSNRHTVLPPTNIHASCNLRLCPPLKVPLWAVLLSVRSHASIRPLSSDALACEYLTPFQTRRCSATVSSSHNTLRCGQMPRRR